MMYFFDLSLAAEDALHANAVFQRGDRGQRDNAAEADEGVCINVGTQRKQECGSGDDARDNRQDDSIVLDHVCIGFDYVAGTRWLRHAVIIRLFRNS